MPRNSQTAPEGQADLIEQVVKEASYKPGWSYRLEVMDRYGEHLKGSSGLTLSIKAQVSNSVAEGDTHVNHLFEVPTADWDRRTWVRWLLDRTMDVEQHEAMEFFKVHGVAPYFPAHGVGANPYEIREQEGWDA